MEPVFQFYVHCSAVHMLPTLGRKIRCAVNGSAVLRRIECLKRVGKRQRVTTQPNSNFVHFGPVPRSGSLLYDVMARKCTTVAYSDAHISDIVTRGTKNCTEICKIENCILTSFMLT